MKVLHVYKTYFPDSQGGLEEAIRQICVSSARKGVNSRVLTTTDKSSPMVIESSEAEVIRVKRQVEVASCPLSLGFLSEYKRQAGWADVINIHVPWPFADVVHLLSGVKKPVVLTYHSDIVRQRVLNTLYSPLATLLFKNASKIVATSPNYFATSENLQRYPEKVKVIALGLDENTYSASADHDKTKVTTTFQKPFFLFVGALRYYKGLHILLEAAKGLDCDIVIAGAGPLGDKLRKQARREKISNITFLGHVSNSMKVALIQQCIGIVFPSHFRSEAFGVTLLEGAMFGKPLISTELGTGTTHVNVAGETGLVVPPGNPPELRQAMRQLMFNPDEAQRMGRAARQRYENLFTGDMVGTEYTELYEQVLAEYRRLEGSGSTLKAAK